jgi:hypothetical protein
MFTETIQISCGLDSERRHQTIKMILDTGCFRNLVSTHVLSDLGISSRVEVGDRIQLCCLNGQTVESVGSITLEWTGNRFTKTYASRFYVVDIEDVGWQVILGSAEIEQHGLFVFPGYGGTPVSPPLTERTSLFKRYSSALADT